MPNNAHNHLINEFKKSAMPLTGHASDYDALMGLVGDAHFVLIGEATHGTEEFYRLRADITKRLIIEKGFSAVAVEADWPDSYRINRYVRGDAAINSANSALREFLRFPTWMWRNEVVVEFIDWLRSYNQAKSLPQEKTGFYGLDLYSLNASIRSVIEYLDKVDAEAASRARRHYGCFGHVCAESPQEYGYATNFGIAPDCEREVIRELIALQQRKYHYLKRNGFAAGEDYFCAEQNAKVVMHAEQYYRNMFQSHIISWNMRDRHMVETLYGLEEHLSIQRGGERAKIVVWAHNSHVGDARATEMGSKGEVNIGSLVREAHGSDAMLIGFSTYRGSVTAASQWDGVAECKIVRPGTAESYEALFHEVGIPNFLLTLRGNPALSHHLSISRLQRAVGVLYLPQTERQSHYFFSKLPEQFDAIIHLDTTRALQPLETTTLWHEGEVFETYPTGI